MIRYSEAHTVSPKRALAMAGNPPEIPGGFDLIVDMFMSLSTERPVTEGAVLFIPISKIIEHVQWNGIENVRLVAQYIQAMDSKYVELQQQSLKKQTQ